MGYVILLWHSLSLPYNYLVISCSSFENGILVLIVPVPGHCLLFPFSYKRCVVQLFILYIVWLFIIYGIILFLIRDAVHELF